MYGILKRIQKNPEKFIFKKNKKFLTGPLVSIKMINFKDVFYTKMPIKIIYIWYLN